MVCGPFGKPLEDALAACHQDVNLYHNALTRLAGSAGMGSYEHAESVMVLFIAAGCSANVRASVTYALDSANTTCAGGTSTPLHVAVAGLSDADERDVAAAPLGLMSIEGDFVAGYPHWVEPSERGIELGALCVGDGDITAVGSDVSARHARLWCNADGEWFVEDLGSTNGTRIEDGSTGEVRELVAGKPARLRAGDLLGLGAATTFAIMSGLPGTVGHASGRCSLACLGMSLAECVSIATRRDPTGCHLVAMDTRSYQLVALIMRIGRGISRGVARQMGLKLRGAIKESYVYFNEGTYVRRINACRKANLRATAQPNGDRGNVPRDG